MHYIIQDGFFNETGMTDLVDYLERLDIPFTLVKVVPFVGEIIPDVEVAGNVICFGSYSMRHHAKKKNWYPGVFDLEEIADQLYTVPNVWTKHLLNADSVICSFADVGITANNLGLQEFMLRPVSDSKVFAGGVMRLSDYMEWRRLVVDLEEDDGTSLRANTECMVSAPKQIYSEYRIFVIGDKVVTQSQYKINSRVQYSRQVGDDVISFAKERIAELHLADAYCLDLCRTPGGIKIVEVNTLNAAGFYHADVQRIVNSLEELYSV